MTSEQFISVDVETSGPIPGEYSLLSIGACLVHQPQVIFEATLKPINTNFDPEALKVTGFSMDDLLVNGEPVEEALRRFANWVNSVTPIEVKPVFVGFNAAFDWSFINYYFHRFIGHNPFGFAALDIKSLYMGAQNSTWGETKSSLISAKLRPQLSGNHNALDDAKFQAELFRLIVRGT